MPQGRPFLALLLTGLLASPARAKDAPTHFIARFEGARYGLEAGCVVWDPRPAGAWTVRFTVAEPRASGLAIGDSLCALVESPALFRRVPIGEDGQIACEAAWGTSPPRFHCGVEPDPRMTILSPGDVAAALALGGPPQLQAELGALETTLPGLDRCTTADQAREAGRVRDTARYVVSRARRSRETAGNPGLAALLELAPVIRGDVEAVARGCVKSK
jgi:hypothetical protein